MTNSSTVSSTSKIGSSTIMTVGGRPMSVSSSTSTGGATITFESSQGSFVAPLIFLISGTPAPLFEETTFSMISPASFFAAL